MPASAPTRSLLALTLTPGLGPILIRRLLDACNGDATAVLSAPLAALRNIKGIGNAKAQSIHTGLRAGLAAVDAELALAAKLGVRLISLTDPNYPPLLRQIPDPPPVLYVKGELRCIGDDAPDRYPVAIVGSRNCTPYGIEQAERFAGHMAAAGLTVVSGGARGIDTAAHRAALRNRGRTVAVLGCGLAKCYPEENAQLFAKIAGSPRTNGVAPAPDAQSFGAVISELPLNTPPAAENFPARNRIISGLSLGVLVIEAGRGSGALITARLAAEDHGREVFALPGRVDSDASRGSLELIKSGGAALVTEPADVLNLLETPARHVFTDTHAARYGGNHASDPSDDPSSLFGESPTSAEQTADEVAPRRSSLRAATLSATQTRILEALSGPMTLDELAVAASLDAGALRADLTILELQRCVVRRGSRIERTSAS